MTITTLVPDTWTAIAAAPGHVTFQNQTRGDVWFIAAGSTPTGGPAGRCYKSGEGETGATLALLFPSGGANLYAYSQLAGNIYSSSGA